MKGKKVIHLGGNRGNHPNFFLEVYSIYLDIQVYYLDTQAISTLYAFYWFLMCNHWFFYNTCYTKCSPEKWCFRSLQSLLLRQFSTYRHRTGFIVKRKQVCMQKLSRNTYKLVRFFLPIFKVIYFTPQKKTCNSENSIKTFFLKSILHMYICTKCNDNFKFSISLKSHEE